MATYPATSREDFLASFITPTTPAHDDFCAICQDAFEASGGEHQAATYSDVGGCRHVFGESCLRRWLGMDKVNACALCRRKLFPLVKLAWEPIWMTAQQAEEVLERTRAAMRERLRPWRRMERLCREDGAESEGFDERVWSVLAPDVDHVLRLFLGSVSEVGQGRWGGQWGRRRFDEVCELVSVLLERERDADTHETMDEEEAEWYCGHIIRLLAPEE